MNWPLVDRPLAFEGFGMILTFNVPKPSYFLYLEGYKKILEDATRIRISICGGE
jgi:hypothetical protein